MPLGMFSYTPVPLNDRFGIWSKSMPGYTPPSPASYGAGAPLPGSTNSRVASTTGTGFNLNPQPTSGQGPHGAVPGQLGLPNPAGDLGAQLPGLSGLNSQASANILSKLQGNLSKNTLDALKDTAAAYGVSSGMPGSGLSDNAFLGNVAGARENLMNQGIQEYNATIPTVSGTQTVNPALQNEIATQNSLNAAAPDPTQAASYAMQLFNMYLQQMGRGSGGGGGGNPGGGGGGIASQVNAAVNPVLSRYNADLDRKIAAGRQPNPEAVDDMYDRMGWDYQWMDGSRTPARQSAGTVNAPYAPMSFDMIAPRFDYNTSPWNPLYGTQQNIPSDFYWE